MKSEKGVLFIPDALTHHVTAIAGERGHQWLADLPKLLKKFSLNWAISIGDCFADASFNYVAPAQCADGARVVFKAGISGAEFSREYANIVFSKTRGWLAIDPKGVIGEPEYEIPLPRLSDQPNAKAVLRCLDQFIEYSGFDRQRILHWAFAKAVLAAWWSLEDTGSMCQKFTVCTEILENRLCRSVS